MCTRAQVLYLSISSFLDKRVEDEERKKYEAAQKARCVIWQRCAACVGKLKYYPQLRDEDAEDVFAALDQGVAGSYGGWA